MYFGFFLFYEYVQRVFTAHSYIYIYDIITHVYLPVFFFLLRRRRRLCRLFLLVICSINMRYLFDICSFLLLLLVRLKEYFSESFEFEVILGKSFALREH